MKPKPQLKLSPDNPTTTVDDSTTTSEPTTPISQMIDWDYSPKTPPFHKSPRSPSSPFNSSLPSSPVTPSSSVLWKHHEPTPLILTTTTFDDDPLIKFSKNSTSLSRHSSQRSTHNVYTQPKVSKNDDVLPLPDLLNPNSITTSSNNTLVYPRVLDISADSSSSEINLLGTGYFCKTVLSQPDAITNKVLAVKIPKNNAQSSLISHEAEILSLIYQDHPQGIISFYGLVYTKFGDFTDISLPGIAMEVYNQTAQKFISNFDPYSQNQLISFSDPFIGMDLWNKWASQLTNGLLYLQSKNIVHCDIKPDNILLDDDLNAFIGDFSSAQTIDELEKSSTDSHNMSSVASTMQYSAPELLLPPSNSTDYVQPDFSTDTFSLGLTLLTFATGNEPYSGAVKHFTQKLLWARKGAALEACPPEDKLRLTNILPILESFLIERKTLSEIKL